MREVDGEFIISLTQTQTEQKPGNISPRVSAIFIQTGESNGFNLSASQDTVLLT